ncbi:MAG: MotA/TolQ/ExbB proton channel family protein [Planctomycetes bacterium]|nr:MotA/TolQ/ExbB proton channel family protein [Planctomycetota bacterium]
MIRIALITAVLVLGQAKGAPNPGGAPKSGGVEPTKQGAVDASKPALGDALHQTPAELSRPSGESIKIHSVWDFVTKGGPTMLAIALCSLIALSVIVERGVMLRRRAVAPPSFLNTLRAVESDRERALALCDADTSPVASVLVAVIRNRGRSHEIVEKAVRSAGSRVLARLRHRMRLLSALPQVATMLGLLGTIFGMIRTFQSVATSGQSLGKTEMLAQGIFEAWTNTAAGLLVAIPTLVAYHVLMGRIDSAAAELDRIASEWMDRDVPTMPTISPSSSNGSSLERFAPTAVSAPSIAIPSLAPIPSGVSLAANA